MFSAVSASWNLSFPQAASRERLSVPNASARAPIVRRPATRPHARPRQPPRGAAPWAVAQAGACERDQDPHIYTACGHAPSTRRPTGAAPPPAAQARAPPGPAWRQTRGRFRSQRSLLDAAAARTGTTSAHQPATGRAEDGQTAFLGAAFLEELVFVLRSCVVPRSSYDHTATRQARFLCGTLLEMRA